MSVKSITIVDECHIDVEVLASSAIQIILKHLLVVEFMLLYSRRCRYDLSPGSSITSSFSSYSFLFSSFSSFFF